MTFLKNERAGKRWVNAINRSQPQAPVEGPTEYPCYGYTDVASFGYEEVGAYYLYGSDLCKMVRNVLESSR